MKRLILLTTIVAVALAFHSAPAQTTDVNKLKYPPLNPLTIPQVEKITLDNGLRIYLSEDHELPVFRMHVAVNCGSYLEPADKIGLVEILGEVLRTGGTAKWSGDQLDEMLEGIGGSVETSAGVTEIGAGVWVLSENIGLGLEVLSEILRRPLFDQDKIDLAKVNERTAIARRNDQPRQLASREFSKIIYGPESPYARQTELATIEAITREDLVGFHQAWFHPEIIQMAVCGDFDRKTVLEAITSLFGDWERGEIAVPKPPAVDYDFTPGIYFIEKSDVNQSQIYMGHIGGMMTDPDNPTRIVMSTIMGGGSGSRMYDAVRSREGLAYTALSSYSAGFDVPGVFTSYAATKSQSTGKAIREMVSVIKSMQSQPPTEQELQYGRDSYLNSFVFQFESPYEVVNRIMNYDYFGLTGDFLQQTRDGVEKVSAEAVIAAAKNNLRPEALRVLVVGRSADFDIPLDSLGFGPVKTIDLTAPSEQSGDPQPSDDPVDPDRGRALLGLAVEAHGGLERFKNLHSISFEGATSVIVGGQEMKMEYHSLRELPEKSLSVIDLMGQEILDISDGTNGWKTDRRSGNLVAKSNQEMKEEARDRDRGLLLIFKRVDDTSYHMEYEGLDSTGTTVAEYVVLKGPDGSQLCRLGIDSDTHLLVSQSYWGKTPLGEGMVTEKFVNWADVKGMKLPGKVVSYLNDLMFRTALYYDFEINPEIPPGSFQRP